MTCRLVKRIVLAHVAFWDGFVGGYLAVRGERYCPPQPLNRQPWLDFLSEREAKIAAAERGLAS